MKKIRQLITLLVKVGIATIVLGYLLHKMGLAKLGDTIKSTAGEWPWLLAGLVLILAPLLWSVERWKTILDALEMKLGWMRVGTLFFIGLFFNAFMIGPTGGDLIKAYYTAKETHHKKTEAVATVFIDRVVGLLALALIAGTMILVRWDFYASNPTTRLFAWPVLIACAILLGGSILTFSVNLFTVFPFLKRWNHIKTVGTLVNTLERAYNAFYVFRARPSLLLKLMSQAVLIHVLFVCVAWCVGKALSIEQPFLVYLSFIPMVGLISAIPITPGGIGIREGISIQLWGVMGVHDEKAFLLGFIPYLFQVLWGLPGGLLFLFNSSDSLPPLSRDVGD